MRIIYGDGQTTLSAKSRLQNSLTGGLLISIAYGYLFSWHVAPLLGWDVAALIFTVSVWTTIWPMSPTDTSYHAVREDSSRAITDIVMIIASIASLVALGLVLIKASQSHGFSEIIQVCFAVLSVVISWLVVHTLYTLRYAEHYYTSPRGGVDFKESTKPSYSDFAYLAFTVGMTFQVSDTDLQTERFRKTALKHALLSYLFGTIIVATTINLIAGFLK
ncbi:MAG: DUF1345 domain-containing protein [Candidatus Saccharimonadales bacterium]